MPDALSDPMQTASAIRALERSLEIFSDGWHVTELHGKFLELRLRLHFASVVPPGRPNLVELEQTLQAASQDMRNVATLLHRLDWIRAKRAHITAFDHIWAAYAQLDVQTFHVEVRSLLDHVASAVAQAQPKPKTVPKSFRKLLEWADANPARMATNLRELLLEQKRWFSDLRHIRDGLVHGGDHPMVFGNASDGILFQVVPHRANPVVLHPVLMHNEHTIHFDRYATLILARLLCFLEELAPLMCSALALHDKSAGIADPGPGYTLLKNWLRDLLTRLKAK